MMRFIGSLMLAGLLACSPALAQERPNILVILADDLGYDSTSIAPGGPAISTPAIDALARQGASVSNGYSAAAICAPARAGLLTGRYPHRFGFENNPPPGETRGVPLTEVMLPARLKAAGYQTGAVGKWHQGSGKGYRPNERGFDYFFGFLPSASDYFDPQTLYRNDKPVSGAEVTYLTDTFATEAVEFLRRTDRTRPWFLYLAFNAVHVPLQATPELLARVSHIPEGKQKTYAAMVLGLDDAIARVMSELRRLGQADNTFIWFQSDNGGRPAEGASNFPLKGGKGSLYEGGIRVPTYVSWPGQIRAGRVMTGPISGLDLVPTALAAARAPAAKGLDGIDTLPSLKSAAVPVPPRPLAWRTNTACTDSVKWPKLFALRQGRWKLLEINGVESVFDLLTDVGETKPVNNPAVLQSLRLAKRKWEVQMPPSMWCEVL